MNRLRTLQFVGPVALFAAVLAAEAAAYALARYPSSEWLWYLNLTWFSMFQTAHYTLKGYLGVDCEQFLCIAVPLLVAAIAGLALKRPLPLAISSNVSFVYIGFVLYTWCRSKGYTEQASLSVDFVRSSNPDLILLAVLAGLSLISFVVSHIAFIQRARAEAR
jgi:hypothetical protein